MPALVGDIAAGTRGMRIESLTDAEIKERYANARDGSIQPSEGFFDFAADARAGLAMRRVLIGTDRRRFKVVAGAIEWPEVDPEGLSVLLVDPEQRIDAAAMITRIEVSLDDEITVFEVFG